jgi:hypothetical protein
MRFVETEVSGKDKTRYLFALGKAEAVILHSLLEKAYKFMPKTFVTQTTQARVRNMRNAIADAIPRMKKMSKDDYSFLNESASV